MTENEQIEIVAEMQNVLDENKSELSDKVYKNLSELNLKQFEIHKNNFYSITYLVQRARRDYQSSVTVRPVKKQQYIKIPEETYQELKTHLDSGKNCLDCLLCFDIIKQQLIIDENYLNFEGSESCEDEECLYRSEYFREVKINPSIFVLDIEKA